jgi:hypothetical protein
MSEVSDLKNIVTTTLNAWSNEVFNNVTDANALLFYFKSFGKLGLLGKGNEPMGSIETKNGGKQIEEDVALNENTNVGFVAYNATVGTDAIDVLDMAIFDWKYCYGNAVLYDAEMAVNEDSQYRKHKIVEEVILNAEETMINAIGAGLWNVADTNSIDGLPSLITDDGTGTIGGLSTSVYPNWKNQFIDVAATYTPDELRSGMGKLYRACTRGQSAPDLIVMHPDLYGVFEDSLTPNQRFTNAKMADAGFQNLKFHGATVIYDENCPANRAYFLNTKAIVFNFHKTRMFKVGKMEKEFGQEKYSWPIVSMCNLSVRRRRDLGVLVVDGTTSYTVTGVSVANGGTGYDVADVLTIPGTGSDTPATATVSTVNGSGAITGITLTTGGTYSAVLSGPITVTGGTGSGATLTVTMA